MAPAELGRELGQHVVGRDADEPERERPDLAGRELAGPRLQRVGVAEQPPRLGQQRGAGGGQPDGAPGAAEERGAELGLEAPDLARQRRLRDVEPRGGAAEAQVFGHGHEVAKVAQLH